MEKVTVKVPATSANLGPGFDCVGIALSMYDTVTFEKRKSGLTIEGCPAKYRNKNNLAALAYNKTAEYMKAPTCGLYINIRTNIPVARGLGSSAALIVAGAVAANALNGGKLTKEELLSVCTEIEGHPDNLAPAIFGGLTASFMDGKTPYTVEYDIAPCWHFTAVIPNFPLSTKNARAVLPDKIPFRDAVFNISRTAVLLKAFEQGNAEILNKTMHDRLHQPYRASLIEEYDTVETIARDLGASGFYLSGAGPTLMCVSKEQDFSEKLGLALREKCKSDWLAVGLPIAHGGAELV